MSQLKKRLDRLESKVAPDKKYWCEITEDSIIFHGPTVNVILPAKDELFLPAKEDEKR